MNTDHSKTEDSQTTPKLANPGDGISLFELFILRAYIKPLAMNRLSLSRAIQNLDTGHSIIIKRLQLIRSADLTKKVLINRPYFVEDSSRFWSAAMLCNHIGKVNGALAKAIESGYTLTPGQNYNTSDRLKSVKPDLEKNLPQEIDSISLSTQRIKQAILGHSESDLKIRKIPHPWLGDLNYLQWIWFAGFHMKVHARQLELISSALRSS